MNTKLTFKQSITAGVLAAAVAALINAILFFLFQSMGVITDDIMVQPDQPMTILPIVMSSVLPILIGACVFFLFEKYGKNGYKTFRIVAIILLILSFGNPFIGIPNITIAYAMALIVMHVVVAGSLLYFIKRAKD